MDGEGRSLLDYERIGRLFLDRAKALVDLIGTHLEDL